MVRQVTGTIATRVLVMATNLLVIMVAGHRLGTEGVGVISLIVLAITFAVLMSNVMGGGAVVFLTPRHPLRSLLLPAYAWALLSALVAWAVLSVLPLVPHPFTSHVVVLALLQSTYTIHLGVLLGSQRIRVYNTIVSVQAIVLLVVFVLLMRPGSAMDVSAYVWASHASFGTTLLLSTLALPRRHAPAAPGTEPAWRAMFRHGFLIQAANGLQLLNYRLSYYLIEAFRGTHALGLYAVANQLAESAWVVPKSLGMVLYSRISNTPEAERRRDLTLAVAKAAVACSVLVVLILLMVPEPLFRWLFGPEMIGLPLLVLLLAPGIVAMAASQAFSHYFSGVGQNRRNVICSGIGMVITLAGGFALIPMYGLEGAAATASLAYSGSTLYLAFHFMRDTGTTPRMLWYTRADGERLTRLWNAALGKADKSQ